MFRADLDPTELDFHLFVISCHEAAVEPTRRQHSKWRKRKGSAWNSRPLDHLDRPISVEQWRRLAARENGDAYWKVTAILDSPTVWRKVRSIRTLKSSN